jgi:hypothetical protein
MSVSLMLRTKGNIDPRLILSRISAIESTFFKKASRPLAKKVSSNEEEEKAGESLSDLRMQSIDYLNIERRLFVDRISHHQLSQDMRIQFEWADLMIEFSFLEYEG